ncbi:hypothetical protein F4811DRAFT_517077 [Daldinia bambusicola]|nr:hypothetical protein F4811DRAFT_517077 [Daldinia bambusicola]
MFFRALSFRCTAPLWFLLNSMANLVLTNGVRLSDWLRSFPGQLLWAPDWTNASCPARALTCQPRFLNISSLPSLCGRCLQFLQISGTSKVPNLPT